MKKLLTSLFLFVALAASAQTVKVDTTYLQGTYQIPVITTTITNTVTVTVHDTVYVQVPCDSDTVIVTPPPPPAEPQFTVKGMYATPSQVTIGSSSIETAFLNWVKREGVNTLNLYQRAKLDSKSERDQVWAFEQKAKAAGIVYMTIDIRTVQELPYWIAYWTEHPPSMVHMLTELEPWRTNSDGIYPYDIFWPFLRQASDVAKRFGRHFNFYTGWPGNHNPGGEQQGWDSVCYHVNRTNGYIYISNYTTLSDYNKVNGAWDSRMQKRCNYIADFHRRNGGSSKLVEIESLELIKWGAGNDFRGLVYACPASSSNQCHSFFGSRYERVVSEYNAVSTSAVKQYTDLVGRTIFYAKYGMLAHP